MWGPRSVTLDNALSNYWLTIIVVLEDCLKKGPDLDNGHVCSHASHSPLNYHMELPVDFGTVLVPGPTLRLPFLMHFLDYLMGQVTLKASSVSNHELAFVCKIGFMATL